MHRRSDCQISSHSRHCCSTLETLQKQYTEKIHVFFKCRVNMHIHSLMFQKQSYCERRLLKIKTRSNSNNCWCVVLHWKLPQSAQDVFCVHLLIWENNLKSSCISRVNTQLPAFGGNLNRIFSTVLLQKHSTANAPRPPLPTVGQTAQHKADSLAILNSFQGLGMITLMFHLILSSKKEF